MKFGQPTMPAAMLVPLLLMLAGFTLYFVALLLIARARARCCAASATRAGSPRQLRRGRRHRCRPG